MYIQLGEQTRPRSRPIAARRGATTVEFALTVPILFLLVMAAVEFSRGNIVQHTATVAAAEGARAGIVAGATRQDCRAAAQRELAAVGIQSARIYIKPNVIRPETEQVTVKVEVVLNARNGFIFAGFLTGTTISKKVTLQREAKRVAFAEEPDIIKKKRKEKKKKKRKMK